MTFSEAIMWVVLAHFLGDWMAQLDWIAKWKGKSWLVMLAHCMIYTAFCCIALKYIGSNIIVTQALILVSTHFVIDEWKCFCTKDIPVEKFPTWHVYFDQVSHLCILLAMIRP